MRAAHPAVGKTVVVDRPARSEGHDRVIAERIGEHDVQRRVVGPAGRHHLEGIDVETQLGKGLTEQSLRRRGVVVEEQHLTGHRFTVRVSTAPPVG